MEKYVARYKELCHGGVCAHAAASMVIGALYSDCRQEGYSFEEAVEKGRALLKKLTVFAEDLKHES